MRRKLHDPAPHPYSHTSHLLAIPPSAGAVKTCGAQGMIDSSATNHTEWQATQEAQEATAVAAALEAGDAASYPGGITLSTTPYWVLVFT